MTRALRSIFLGGLAAGAVACGSETRLTPELIAQRSFEQLKADDFRGYFTGLVATPALVRPLCPNIPGFDRYFETGEASEQQQGDAWVACRAAIEFTGATFVRANVVRQSAELAPPRCSQPIENTDVTVEVRLRDGRTAEYTIDGVMQFSSGYRAYRRLRNCAIRDDG